MPWLALVPSSAAADGDPDEEIVRGAATRSTSCAESGPGPAGYGSASSIVTSLVPNSADKVVLLEFHWCAPRRARSLAHLTVCGR